MGMDDEVNVTSVDVTQDAECSNIDLEFYSAKGVVRLEMTKIFFAKLSYSVVSSTTGIHYICITCR